MEIKLRNSNNKKSQVHSGSGDNILGNKIINNNLIQSIDYKVLKSEIDELEELLIDIPKTKKKSRLKIKKK